MATVQDQTRPATGVKQDTFVRQQFDRVRQRVRNIDLAAAGFLLLSWTLVFFLASALLDRKLVLADSVRQIALVGFLLTVSVVLALGIVRPLLRKVNLYYAARALEETVPEAKNSLVNWLDLREEKLPRSVRVALTQRAARDLKQSDLERAVSARRLYWFGAGNGLLIVAVLVLLVVTGPSAFATHLARTFAPFSSGPTVQRTRISLVRPAGGDATVSVGQAVNVEVRVEGVVPSSDKPDALKLLLRYEESDPAEEQLLEPHGAGLWRTTIPAARVHNGFLYHVTGGDGTTPEHRISVRGTPLITDIGVTYHPRAYTGWKDEKSPNAALKALRGTEAILRIRTNRTVKDGRVEIVSKTATETVVAERLADDPQALRVRFVVDADGEYRIRFRSTDDDVNLEATAYRITAVPDLPPKVELTAPGDTTLPANGILRVEGKVSDDVGVKEMVLRLRRMGGPTLAARPYRPDHSLALEGGGYPIELDYQDFLGLDGLKDESGRAFPLTKGMQLEYWLEAADACDYPAPNRAESKHFHVTISDPVANPKALEAREKAEKEQKQFEKVQDDKRTEEAKKKSDPTELEQKLQDLMQKLKDALEEQDQQRENDKGDAKNNGSESKSDAKDASGSGADNESDSKGNSADPQAGSGKSEGAGSDGSNSQSKSQGEGQGESAGDKKAEGPSPETGSTKEKGPDGGMETGETKPAPGMGASDSASSKGEGPGQASASSGSGKGDPAAERDRLAEQALAGDAGAVQRLEALQAGDDPKAAAASKAILDEIQRLKLEIPAGAKMSPRDSGGPAAEAKGGSGQGSPSGDSKSGGPGAGASGSSSAKAPGSGSSGPSGNSDKKGFANAGSGGGRGDNFLGVIHKAVAKAGTGAEPSGEPGTGNPDNDRRAGVLQLEDFRKIDKKLLRDLKISDEQLKELRAYAEAKRQGDKESLPSSQPGTLPGGVGTGGQGTKQDPDAHRTGLGKPPREFEEAFREFTRGSK